MGDTVSVVGRVKEIIVAKIKSGWRKHWELLPLLTLSGVSLKGKGFETCVRIVVLYVSKTWAVK